MAYYSYLMSDKIIIGVDYGLRKTGLAKATLTSDVSIATPWLVLPTNELNDFIQNLEFEIDKVVVGKSINLSGRENEVNKEIKKFADTLKQIGINVVFIDERFTTQSVLAEYRMESRKHKNKKAYKMKELDAGAATKILQTYLDSAH